MNLTSVFSQAQTALVTVATLVSLYEQSTLTGAQKKAGVLGVLNQALDALPLSNPWGNTVKTVAKALAPSVVDALVSQANRTGIFQQQLPNSAQP